MDFDDFLNFNKVSYPDRKRVSIETYLNWRIFSNPFYQNFNDEFFDFDNGKITSQVIPIFSKACLNSLQYPCFWGSDYYVDKRYRGTFRGVILLRKFVKSSIHFATGMGDLSLKIHRALKEDEIGIRYDTLFIKHPARAKGIRKISYNEFLNSHYYNYSNQAGRLSFIRTPAFYNWVLAKTDKQKIDIYINGLDGLFIMVYKTKINSFPVNWIIDYSCDFVDSKTELVRMIKNHKDSFFPELYFFCGSLDLSSDFIAIKHHLHPVLTNFFIKENLDKEDVKIHITSLDSDRFINHFL